MGTSSDRTAVVAHMAGAQDEEDAEDTAAGVGAGAAVVPLGTVGLRDSRLAGVDCTGSGDPWAVALQRKGLGWDRRADRTVQEDADHSH